MARGVLSGLIWGSVVAGIGAGGLSLAFPDFKPGAAPKMAEQAVPVATPAVTPEADDSAPKGEDMATAPAAPKEVDAPAMEPMPASEDSAPEPAAAPADAPAPDAGMDQPAKAAPEPERETASETEENDTESADADMAAPDPEAAPEGDTQIAVEPAVDQPRISDDSATETVQAAPTPTPAPTQTPTPTPAPAPASVPETTITEEIVAALPKPAGTIGDLAPDVTTGRLPSVAGDTDQGAQEATAIAPPPLERFASDATFDASKPLMSIVLIDDGTSGLGFEALESFPYPLTFAVDAAAPNAAELMKEYRARGLEVAALVSMPQGATASDTEVAMAGYMAAVPEAVALLEDPDASLQVNRDISDQVVEILQSTGHGIVFQSSGLNTAQKLALREGVASARVFRDFDGSGQKAAVIRRFLDQAAFRAGQEGGVVMLGRLRAETISALLIWGLADRANRVSLVPLSAVLKKNLSASE